MLSDLRFALRQLTKAPGVTAIAVLSLALGIGANAVVFCWIETILLRPLPGVRHGDEIVALLSTHGPTIGHTISPPDIADYNGLTDAFAGVIGSQITPACLTVGQELYWVYGQIATANFFAVLGVKALPGLGRTFLPEDGTKPGGNPVLVLSEGLWRRRFAADPAVVGRTVELNRHRFTIIGVVPAAFRGTMSGLTADFWAPVTMHREVANFGSLTYRSDRWLHTQARLRPGVTIAQAQVAVNVRARQLAAAYPENREMGVAMVPMWNTPYGGQAVFLPALRILAAVGLVILLIVAANVANLLLARATARQRETAIRLAVGARRGHLIRQWLTESVLLALLGGALGLVFTMWASTLFRIFMPETPLPAGYDFTLDARVILVTTLLTVATGVAFGLAPALQAARANLNDVLKQGGRSGAAGGPSARLRGALVVAEVALALVLLVAASLCLRGSRQARQIDPGFEPRQALVAGLRIGMNGYDEPRAKVFYRQLRERLAAAPGVQAVGLASWFPLGFEGGPSIGVTVEGYTPAPNEDTSIPYSIISPGYFAALRIPLLAGRDFSDRDDPDAPLVVIVNETMARRFWPGQDPLGRKLRTWRGTAEVVGMTKAGKYRSLKEPPQPYLYLPYQQGVWDLNLGVVLRTAAGDPRALGATLRQELHALDPGVALWTTLPMTEYVEAAYLVNRIASGLLAGLGALALVLAAMGIYGVMAYAVSQRVPEIGVRMALGAQPAVIARMVIRDGLRLAGLGLVIGGGGAWFAGVGLAHLLPGVSAHDGPAFVGAAVLLTSVAVLASWLPARRAARVDPMIALRAE
jgi:predicted permease